MPIDKRSMIRRVHSLIVQRVMSNSYGEIILKFEHGNIVWVEQLINEKPLPIVTDISLKIQEYLADPITSETSELRLRKVKGKPHVSVVHKGSVEDVIPISIIEEAEAHRVG